MNPTQGLGKYCTFFHPHNNKLYVDNYHDDAFAFDRIEYKVPTQKKNIFEQKLVATTIIVVDTIRNHRST